MLSFQAIAQNNFRFADSTAVWNQAETIWWEGFGGPGWAEYQTNIYRVTGDVFFNNLYYQKISPGYTSASVLLRKDSTGKVFFYDSEFQVERLVYDFSLSQGDTLRLYNPYNSDYPPDDDTIKFVVDSTDYIVYGASRKRMFMRCVSEDYCFWYNDDIMIEGIGSLHSHLISPGAYECRSIPGNEFDLLCYSENGITYTFSSSCFVDVQEILSERIKVYPNPVSEFLFIDLPQHEPVDVCLSSALGVELFCEKHSGNTSIDMRLYPESIYLLQIKSSAGSVSKRIVLER